jgi:hypothetical protein
MADCFCCCVGVGMRKLWLGIIVALLMLAGVAQAQDTGWEAVLLEQGDNGAYSVIVVNAEGVVAGTTLSDATLIPLEDTFISEAVLSPDRRYLALTFYLMNSDTPLPVAIYNLETESCCVYVELPEQAETTGAFDLGSFSPDSSQLALSYVAADYGDVVNPFQGGLMIVDAAIGDIIEEVPIEEMNAAFTEQGGYEGAWALLGDWREDGIRLYPNCYACEPAFEGNYALWNPETGQFTWGAGEGFSIIYGDTLESTGELVYLNQNPAFPASTEPSYLPVPNVVEYYPSGTLPEYEDRISGAGNPIYFNPDDIALDGTIHWVLGGQAFLIAQNNAWTVVYRNGRTAGIEVTDGERFITGTPDGWLAAVPVEGEDFLSIVAYTPLSDDGAASGFTISEITTIAPTFFVLETPELGADAVLGLFEMLTPPPPQPTATSTVCQGFLPSRLTVGTQARVTPGSSNNLREQPTTGGTLVAVIPAGGEFTVLTGPLCAEGIAWWQVDYEGIIGWTAEGQGSTYYLEPLP